MAYNGFGVATNVLTASGSPTLPGFQAASGGTVTSVSGTTNQVAVATGTTTPVISLVGPYTPSTYTSNGILYGQTTSSILSTASVNNGILITSNTGVPSLLANSGTAGFVLTANTGAPPSWQATAVTGLTTVGDVTTGNVAFDGTIGTTLTSTVAGLNLFVQAQGANTLVGGAITITSGSGGTSGLGNRGGNVTITAGTSNGSAANNGGNMSLNGGIPSSSGNGGNISLNGGAGGSTTGNGGSITLSSGNATTSGRGGTLTIIGGNSVGTNQIATPISISTGTGTGSALPAQIIISSDTAGTGGTTSHVAVKRLVLNGSVNLTSAVAATLVTATLTGLQTTGGTIDYSIECSDGTDIQVITGIVAYSGTQKSATIAGTTSILGTEAKQLTAGTLTSSWAFTSGGLVQLTATTSLTATTFRVTFNVNSMAQGNVSVA